MSFNNVKLVHTFGSFIYFAFPASADNMSDMRSGGCGGGGILPLIQEANRDMLLDGRGSHFHDWSDSIRIFQNGVANFRNFGVSRDSKGKILG